MSFIKKRFSKLYQAAHHASGDSSGYSTPNKEEGPNGSLSNGTSTSSSTNESQKKDHGVTYGTDTPHSRRRSREVIAAERKRRSMNKERAKAETRKRELMARIEDEKFIQEGPHDLTKLYKPFSMNMSKRWNHENRLLFKDLDLQSTPHLKISPFVPRDILLISAAESEGKIITFRARIHTLRRMSAKLVFIVFRQQTITIQGVLQSSRRHEDVKGALYR